MKESLVSLRIVLSTRARRVLASYLVRSRCHHAGFSQSVTSLAAPCAQSMAGSAVVEIDFAQAVQGSRCNDDAHHLPARSSPGTGPAKSGAIGIGTIRPTSSRRGQSRSAGRAKWGAVDPSLKDVVFFAAEQAVAMPPIVFAHRRTALRPGELRTAS
jgi:hypothetical protein